MARQKWVAWLLGGQVMRPMFEGSQLLEEGMLVCRQKRSVNNIDKRQHADD